jgi:hypothetical protein
LRAETGVLATVGTEVAAEFAAGAERAGAWTVTVLRAFAVAATAAGGTSCLAADKRCPTEAAKRIPAFLGFVTGRAVIFANGARPESRDALKIVLAEPGAGLI